MGDLVEAWMERHVAFLWAPSPSRPVELRRRALAAVDAGGADGVAMVDVHRAVKSAHLPSRVVNMLVDRLVADGHVHREQIPTAGRPRVQMWSFRHVAADPARRWLAEAMADPCARDLPSWAGKAREALIGEVLDAADRRDLCPRALEVAAWQMYGDADRYMVREMFRGPRGAVMSNGQMKAFLSGLARDGLIGTGRDGSRAP